MFNTTTNLANNIKIQSCSGGIYKSHPKSRLVRIHLSSSAANNMLNPGYIPTVSEREVVVLQIVNAASEYLLVEYMYKEDYEAAIENP